jgi:type IV pilus assembly protein PilO
MAINVSLSRLSWYGQVGVFLALALAGVGVFWNFYARPAQDRIEAQRAQVTSLRRELDRGLATARRLPEFRAQVSQLEAQLERLETVLPEEKDVADLLRRIQGMATQSNLTIRGFTPQAVATRQLHAEWPIGLELEGTYHNLGAFLERVSKFPRIINVSGIQIRSKERPDPSGATITAQCTATTFVLLEPTARPAPTAKPAAKPRPARAPRKTE